MKQERITLVNQIYSLEFWMLYHCETKNVKIRPTDTSYGFIKWSDVRDVHPDNIAESLHEMEAGMPIDRDLFFLSLVLL
jgi:hypothetical protein